MEKQIAKDEFYNAEDLLEGKSDMDIRVDLSTSAPVTLNIKNDGILIWTDEKGKTRKIKNKKLLIFAFVNIIQDDLGKEKDMQKLIGKKLWKKYLKFMETNKEK